MWRLTASLGSSLPKPQALSLPAINLS
jgi:hypothetical protein